MGGDSSPPLPVVFFHGVLGLFPYGVTLDLLAEVSLFKCELYVHIYYYQSSSSSSSSYSNGILIMCGDRPPLPVVFFQPRAGIIPLRRDAGFARRGNFIIIILFLIIILL